MGLAVLDGKIWNFEIRSCYVTFSAVTVPLLFPHAIEIRLMFSPAILTARAGIAQSV
jgi:hypothetical protein